MIIYNMPTIVAIAICFWFVFAIIHDLWQKMKESVRANVVEPDVEEPVVLDVVLPKGFSIVESYYTHRYEKYVVCLKNSKGNTYWLGARSKEQAEQDALWICKNNPALKY